MNDWYVIHCLLNNSKEIGNILTSIKTDYFSEDLTVNIYEYIKSLVSKGISPTKELIVSRFIDNAKEINKSLDVNIDVSEYQEYVNNLRSSFVNREIKKLLINIQSSKDINEDKFRQHIKELLTKISYLNSDETYTAQEAVDELIKELESGKILKSDILFGIDSVDEHSGGLFPGSYIVIAGRPSMGKSALMQHIAMHNALKNIPTILFSLEMSAPKIMLRMLSNLSGIEIWKIKRLNSRPTEEQKHIKSCWETLQKMPLIIDTTAGLTINIMKSVIEKFLLQHGKVGLVIVDYLQLMVGSETNDNSRVSAMSREMKNIANQYRCPNIVGSQLSRLCEQRENKRPQLSDLRDSGTIEQDADDVYFVYRDHYYTLNPDHERILELIHKKARDGEIGKVIVDYNKRTQSIQSIDNSTKLGKLAKKFEYE